MSNRRNLLLSYLATQIKWLPYSFEYIYHNLIPSELPTVNLWDEEWEVGNISSGVPTPADNRIRCKNYIKVSPNVTYYSCNKGNGYINIAFYDINYNFISDVTKTNATFTTPSNCLFIKIWANPQYGTTYNHNITINVSNPAINGIYYPYKPRKVKDKTRLVKISGNSEVVNQLVDYSKILSSGSGTNYSWVKNNDDTITITISATITSDTTFYLTNNSSSAYIKIPVGNKALFNTNNGNGGIAFFNGWNGTTISNLALYTMPSNSDGNIFLGIRLTVGLTAGTYTIKPYIVDLSKDYPFDTPTSITDPRVQNIIAQGYRQYNSGEIKNSVISELETKGFNIWDEEWKICTLNTTTGVCEENENGGYIGFKTPISVIPSSTIHILFPSSTTLWLFKYGINGEFVGYETFGGGGGYNYGQNIDYNIPSNTYYIALYKAKAIYGTTYNHDICINRSSSLNGTYKPHMPNDKIQLPAPLELAGVNTAKNTFEITSTEYVFTRNVFDYTFSGSESFSNVGSKAVKFAISNIKRAVNNSTPANIICDGLMPDNGNNIYNGVNDYTIGVSSDSDDMRFYINGYNATNIGTFLTGKTAYYQLATPQTIRIPRKHLKAVRLKDLNWRYDSGATNPNFYSTDLTSLIKSPSANSQIFNGFCSNYITVSRDNVVGGVKGIACGTNGIISVRDTTYTDATTFKNHFTDNDYLFYETQDEVADFIDEATCQAGGEINGKQPNIPQEFQEVEYIESSGTQYIDTGVIPQTTNQTKVEGAFALTDITSGENQSIGVNNNINIYANSGTFYFRLSAYTTNIPLDKVKHTYSMQITTTNRVCTFDNLSFSSNLPSEIAPLSYCLGGLNTYIGIIYWGKYKIYEHKFYDNNTLIRDFVPCYRKADNVIGLYDKVNGVFYTNAGTGTFLKGNDVDGSYTCEVLPNVDVKFKCK